MLVGGGGPQAGWKPAGNGEPRGGARFHQLKLDGKHRPAGSRPRFTPYFAAARLQQADMLNPRQAGFAAIVFFKRRVPCRRQAVIGFFIPRRARVSGQRVMLGGMAIHRIRNIEIREIPYRPAGGPAIHYSALLARKGAGCSVEDTLMAQSVPQSLSPSVPQSLSPSVPQSFSPSVLQSFSPSVLQS